MPAAPPRLRLLVADDDPALLRLLERLLPTWGYEVSTATNGNEAWALLQEPERPALALLDWSMPGVQGPEICRRLRAEAREPYVYVLLLTAKHQQEDMVEAIQAGADDFVRKPFDRAELQARLWAGRRIVDMQAELARTREVLRTQALHDVLTGLWNRRAILDALERELARARRGSLPVAVALLDLDHFKRVNDTYGHAAGDSVLKEAAARMAGTVRPYDPIGRYGGEEFLVILPGCDEAGAQRTDGTGAGPHRRGARGDPRRRARDLVQHRRRMHELGHRGCAGAPGPGAAGAPATRGRGALRREAQWPESGRGLVAAYGRARRRPRIASTTRCNVLEAVGTSSWRHRRDLPTSTAAPASPARVTHSITGCSRMVDSPDRRLGIKATGGTGCASSSRAWRRASGKKGEPAGRRVVTRDSVAESKRSRRPGRTTWLHSRRGGSGGRPSMYANQRTPSLAVNGMDSVRGLPRG